MKLRLVQDHDAGVQPWFRIDQYAAPSDSWHCIDSGSDKGKMHARFERMCKTNSTLPEITVIDEREV